MTAQVQRKYQSTASMAVRTTSTGRTLFVVEGGRSSYSAPELAQTHYDEDSVAPQNEPGISLSQYLAVLLLTLAFVLVFVGALWARESAYAAEVSSTLNAASQEVIVVQAGDTLWSIASECTDGEISIDVIVDWIEETNSLDPTATLSVGQRLVVPMLE